MYPTGRIIRSFRLTERHTTDDGAEVTLSVSGAGLIFHIKPEVSGQKPADVRRAFARAARVAGVILTVVERTHGHYDQQGKSIAEGTPSAYQGVGTLSALTTLAGHYAVADAHPAVAASIPFGAMGTGPEKARPPMGSRFGRPGQVKSTADQLHADRVQRLIADRKAGRI